MDNTERYLNFVRNYNEKLKEKGTIWLGPEDMGTVLLQTAAENHAYAVARNHLDRRN